MQQNKHEAGKKAAVFGAAFCYHVRDFGISQEFFKIIRHYNKNSLKERQIIDAISEINIPLFRITIVVIVDEVCRLLLEFLERHRDSYRLTDESGNEIFSHRENFSKYYDAPGGWIDLYSHHLRAERYAVAIDQMMKSLRSSESSEVTENVKK